MENITNYRRPVLLIIGFVLLIIPFYVQGFWIIVLNMDNLVTPVEKSNFYMSHFPSFLQSHITLLLISFLCCLAAFIMSALSLNKLKSSLKWLAYVIIAVSFLVGSLSMFQMM